MMEILEISWVASDVLWYFETLCVSEFGFKRVQKACSMVQFPSRSDFFSLNLTSLIFNCLNLYIKHGSVARVLVCGLNVVRGSIYIYSALVGFQADIGCHKGLLVGVILWNLYKEHMRPPPHICGTHRKTSQKWYETTISYICM